MSVSLRPRRSVLYVPGSNTRAIEKARSLAVDAIIFDLEDAVAPAQKAEARGHVLAALRDGGFGPRECIVRCNGLDTRWAVDDLEAIARSGADALLVPKINQAADVIAADAALARHGASAVMALWAMMETPLAMLNAAAIVPASPRLTCLVMGTSDLAKDLHAQHTPDRLPFITGLGLCLLAARAHGRAILDGVHLDLDDLVGFEAQCRQGLALGFDGKTLIHPKTIELANRVFAPEPVAVAQARRIIEAHAAAIARGEGVVVVDGRLVEALHVAEAKRTIALADAIASRS
ncbi:MAG: CoA ester lyase [Alphaproteobacteria bacterium]|nr:CoA ester lyase [Alphaproteobacteria bacterium]